MGCRPRPVGLQLGVGLFGAIDYVLRYARVVPTLVRASAYGAFFASGVAGLVYELLWSKYLTLFIGGTALAHTIVLATFMGGLAFGNALFGRLADRPGRDRLMMYALLELGIGLFCLLFPALFERMGAVYVALASRGGPDAAANPFFKAGLAAASLWVPCMLMGGTLPVLAKYIVDSLAGVGVRLSWLYFVNTAGAVAGCLLGGFVIVERWGLELGMVAAALVNCAIAGWFYLLRRSTRDRDRQQRQAEAAAGFPAPAAASLSDGPIEPAAVYTPGQARTAFWSIAVAGALTMLYELVWFRLLLLSIGGTVHSFAIMLAGFIGGIAVGSWLAGRLLRRPRNALLLFALCELGIMLLTLLPFRLFEQVPFAFFRIGSRLVHAPENYGLFQLCAVAFAALLMGGPATLMGAALPLASRVCVTRLDALGRTVGNTFSVNTIGNVTGALVTGLLLLPWLGLERTLLLGACVSGALGVVLLRAWRPAAVPAPWHWAAATLVVLGAWRAFATPQWDPRVMQAGLYRWEYRYWTGPFADFKRDRARVQTLYARDGADASLLVEDWPVEGVGPDGKPQAERIVRVNGKPDATTGGDLSTQLFVGHLGAFLHPHPRSAMVIGLGSGATAGAVLRHPGMHADVAEISPEMVEAAAHFEAVNDAVLRNPRMSLSVLDAREYLLLSRKSYDVIVSEPTNVWIPGVAMLFTQDFYAMVRRRLSPDGVFVQWLQSYAIDERVVASTLASLTRVFPHVMLWRMGESDLIFVGSRARPAFDPDAFERRFREVQPAHGMPATSNVGAISHPLLFLLNQVSSHQSLTHHWLSASARPYRDLFPRMEFAAARAQFVGASFEFPADLDERFTPYSAEPLLVQEYLARHPLGASDRERLAAVLARQRPPFPRLGQALLLTAASAGPASADAVAGLPDDVAGNLLLTRELRSQLDRPAGASPQACNLYLVRESRVLSASLSVLARPATEDLERRVDACAQAVPDRALEFRTRAIVVLAAAGATERALQRFEQLLASGDINRLARDDQTAMLVQGAQLYVRAGRPDNARLALQAALKVAPDHAGAKRLRLALGARPTR